MNRSARGVTPIVGLVLLIGLVIIASLGILVFGTEAIGDMEQRAEQERVELSFIELSHSISTSSIDNNAQTISHIEAGDHGTIAEKDTGEITLSIEGDETVVSESYSIGAIEYESNDGAIVVYESGGVFRGTGAEAQLLSPPSVNYDLESKTFEMDIFNLNDNTQVRSGEIQIASQLGDPYNDVYDVHEHTFTLRIESQYYGGWKEHFEHRVGDATVVDSGQVEGDLGYVEVVLGYSDPAEELESAGVIYSSETDPDDENPGQGQQDEIFVDTQRGIVAELNGLDKMIAEQNATPITEDSVTAADDTYVLEEIEEGDSYEFDLSQGNATLFVEGNVHVGNDDSITVTNAADDHYLEIYAAGDVLEVNGEVCVEDCGQDSPAKHIRFYGPPDMGVDLGPGGTSATFEGLLYVPAIEDYDWWEGASATGVCDDQQVRLQAGDEFTGAIIAHSACAQAGIDFHYDESLSDAHGISPEPYVRWDGLRVNYLNIVQHEVTVTQE